MSKEKLRKGLTDYYGSVGEIGVYNEGHKEMMILIRPLLKLIEEEINS